MKLAIVADARGEILAAAVCQMVFDNDRQQPRDVSLFARPLRGMQCDVAAEAAKGIRTHIVDAPEFMTQLPREELHRGLEQVHRSMTVHVENGRSALRAQPCC